MRRGRFTSNPLVNESDFRGSAVGGGCITAKRALECECPPSPDLAHPGRDPHPTFGHCRTCGRAIPSPRPPIAFVVGDQVEVFAFRRWRLGVVLATDAKRVMVGYCTRNHLVRHQSVFTPPRRIRARRAGAESSHP